MNLIDYIRHPEALDSKTLAELAALTTRYPYYQAARFVYLKNLETVQDPAFQEQQQYTALHAPCREALFQWMEQQRWSLENCVSVGHQETQVAGAPDSECLIDRFLASPTAVAEERGRKKVVDARTDYMAYLMQMEEKADLPAENEDDTGKEKPRLNHQDLIDDFIGQGEGRIVLSQEEPVNTPDIEAENDTGGDDFLTETLAKIYIKQGRYEKAVEIIRKLSLKYPKKNCYFADQIRFLEKLIINNKNK